jgi:phosphotransferase system  glucose/maltose/N-acetylglucosamine-specific IIC component
MNTQLQEEVNSSVILKGYNTVTKISKYIPYFKWTAGILFVIGFLETIIFGEINKLTMWANIIVWAPGIIFAFVGGFFHFWTGVKLREMCEKYQMEQEELQGKVSEILNSK